MRGKEHQKAAANGNWGHSGISQHKENCSEAVNWEPEVITTMMNKNKKKLTYDLKVREALEKRCFNCGPGKGLNEDLGSYVKTTMWNPVFHRMRSDEVGGGPTLNWVLFLLIEAFLLFIPCSSSPHLLFCSISSLSFSFCLWWCIEKTMRNIRQKLFFLFQALIFP